MFNLPSRSVLSCLYEEGQVYTTRWHYTLHRDVPVVGYDLIQRSGASGVSQRVVERRKLKLYLSL